MLFIGKHSTFIVYFRIGIHIFEGEDLFIYIFLKFLPYIFQSIQCSKDSLISVEVVKVL